MVVQSDTHSSIDHEPISSLLIKTIITAFTFLTAFSIRDLVVKSIQLLAPHNAKREILFNFLIAMFFLFSVVLMAYFWQDKI